MTKAPRLRKDTREKGESDSPWTQGRAQDDTHAKCKEKELRLAQFSIEHIADAVYWVNPQGRIVYANKAACHSLGYSHDDLVSRSIPEIDPLISGEAWARIWKDLKLRGSVSMETQHRTKRGRVFPVEITATYLEFEGKEYSLASARDATERKRAQVDLQRSLDQVRALAGRLQSVREEESKRLAREIHDQLGQALTALRLDVSALIREMQGVTEPLSKRAKSMLSLVDETIRAVRRISSELRPGMLDHLGLVATVEWAGEDFQSRTGIKCRLDLPGEDIAMDRERTTAVYRILQESLTNVARHAAASQVEVQLRQQDKDLTLIVQDNGKGFPMDKLSSRESLGILGMQERALVFGGEVIFCTAPGIGTTVRVTIPHACNA
jgi:PAS domain S-box-containing protein